MQDADERIDEFFRSQGREGAWLWALGVVLLAGALALASLVMAPEPIKEVRATVTSVVDVPSVAMPRLFVRVRLESGENVRALINSTIPVAVGAPVIVSETEIEGGLGLRYEFLRYDTD